VKHGRRDGNHVEIREALRRVPGCEVFDTGDVGDGFPDLVVGFGGDIYLLEVKDGSLPPSQRKLTAAEKKFHKKWSYFLVEVVESVEQAYEAIGLVLDDPPPF
jgi:hypothetical protein